MEKKYIIKLKENEIAYKTVNSNGCPMIGLLHPAPYTEPDLEQVRKEAYEKGFDAGRMLNTGKYEKGINDAWEAARTLWNTVKKKEIFGYTVFGTALMALTGQEAIEKIRQYEQEKEEIQVGDEIKAGNDRYIVLQTDLNNIDEPMAVLFNKRDGNICQWHLYNANGAIFEKTGRHVPEIAAVLEKMRESE